MLRFVHKRGMQRAHLIQVRPARLLLQVLRQRLHQLRVPGILQTEAKGCECAEVPPFTLAHVHMPMKSGRTFTLCALACAH